MSPFVIVFLIFIFMVGARIDIRDSQGNTVLHYAAKYCHLELCKFLVAQRVPVAARNSNNQTAYDVTDNHVIRQYLLPLQFQSEPSDGGYSANSMAQYNIPHQQPVGGYPPAPSPLRQSAGERRVPSAQPSPVAQHVPPPSFHGAVPPAASNLFGVRPPEPLQLPVNASPTPPGPVPAPPLVGPPQVVAAGVGIQQTPLVPAVSQSETVFSAPAPVQSYTPPSVQPSVTNTRIIQSGIVVTFIT